MPASSSPSAAVTAGAPSPVDAGELDRELATLARALGNPARIRILRLLLAQDACYCGQLVDELPIAQATVSQHLKVLKEAGLVVGEIDGPRTRYCASRERLAELYPLVGALLDDAVEVDTSGCD